MDSIKTSGVDPQPLTFSVDIKVNNGEKPKRFRGELNGDMSKNLERALNELIEYCSTPNVFRPTPALMPAS
jgi:hypothetical protein